jgi:hypothetical protein
MDGYTGFGLLAGFVQDNSFFFKGGVNVKQGVKSGITYHRQAFLYMDDNFICTLDFFIG